MELTDRQKQILRAIVDIYVSTAEPVGSKAIAALPDVSCSSATIRNEMAELTQMGLLEQPHTSAGRVPSPAGYRLYIDELMQDYRLSLDETKSLNEALELKSQEFDKMMSQVGKLVSKMTNLPAYTVATRRNEAVAKHFDLIQAGPGSIILVLMLSGDVVKNKLVKLPVRVTEADLKLLAAVLNTSLTDLTAEEITGELLDKITRSAGPASPLAPLVMDFTLECLRQQHGDVHLTGQMRLLGQPEYKDAAGKAQELFAPQVAEPAVGHRFRRGQQHVPAAFPGPQIVLVADGAAPFPALLHPAVNRCGVYILIAHGLNSDLDAGSRTGTHRRSPDCCGPRCARYPHSASRIFSSPCPSGDCWDRGGIRSGWRPPDRKRSRSAWPEPPR